MPTETPKPQMAQEENEVLFKRYDKYLYKAQELLWIAIKTEKIPKAKDLLPKSKSGNIKRATNSSLLYTNQLNKFGLLKVAKKVCRENRKNNRSIMPTARKLGSILWNKLDDKDESKNFFKNRAKQIEAEHKKKYPDYTLKPVRRPQGIKFKYQDFSRNNQQEFTPCQVSTPLQQETFVGNITIQQEQSPIPTINTYQQECSPVQAVDTTILSPPLSEYESTSFDESMDFIAPNEDLYAPYQNLFYINQFFYDIYNPNGPF